VDVKPGYKQTEVGVIPGDWQVYALGKIGKFKNGLNKDGASFGHGSPFVNLMDVFGIDSISSTEHLGLVASSADERAAYDLKGGDVVATDRQHFYAVEQGESLNRTSTP
jgi:type I restriction enzyme S subunit